ncbi:PadR family transcriptional regulator [Oikeobacillus pervagus]|nr:PadR family transcriptional regulator [Oikeobacillus pervagus]
MEDRLKNIKKSRVQERFPGLKFTDELRQRIIKTIQQEQERDEDIMLAILQLLVQKKTGYELLNHLRSRGVKKFEKNEGFLYPFLHSLENKGYIVGEWGENNEKSYFLSSKGRKLLSKVETKPSSFSMDIQEVIKGVMMNEG